MAKGSRHPLSPTWLPLARDSCSGAYFRTFRMGHSPAKAYAVYGVHCRQPCYTRHLEDQQAQRHWLTLAGNLPFSRQMAHGRLLVGQDTLAGTSADSPKARALEAPCLTTSVSVPASWIVIGASSTPAAKSCATASHRRTGRCRAHSRCIRPNTRQQGLHTAPSRAP